MNEPDSNMSEKKQKKIKKHEDLSCRKRGSLESQDTS